jgi:hypothetical protein
VTSDSRARARTPSGVISGRFVSSAITQIHGSLGNNKSLGAT